MREQATHNEKNEEHITERQQPTNRQELTAQEPETPQQIQQMREQQQQKLTGTRDQETAATRYKGQSSNPTSVIKTIDQQEKEHNSSQEIFEAQTDMELQVSSLQEQANKTKQTQKTDQESEYEDSRQFPEVPETQQTTQRKRNRSHAVNKQQSRGTKGKKQQPPKKETQKTKGRYHTPAVIQRTTDSDASISSIHLTQEVKNTLKQQRRILRIPRSTTSQKELTIPSSSDEESA